MKNSILFVPESTPTSPTTVPVSNGQNFITLRSRTTTRLQMSTAGP
jgi:hypothetical protein